MRDLEVSGTWHIVTCMSMQAGDWFWHSQVCVCISRLNMAAPHPTRTVNVDALSNAIAVAIQQATGLTSSASVSVTANNSTTQQSSGGRFRPKARPPARCGGT